MKNCVFCQQINDKTFYREIANNQHFVAWLDLNPITQGHTLIVPKRHTNNMLNLSAVETRECLKFSQKVAQAVLRTTKSDGFNFIHNNGLSAGQNVMHTHFHIIPRKKNDGRKPVHFPTSRQPKTYFSKMRKKIQLQL